jgi:hypothetical protein
VRLFAASLALALVATATQAAPPAQSLYQGVWVYRFGAQPSEAKPEYTPAVAAQLKARQAARPANYVRSAANMLCLPRGGPGLFTIRSPFTIMEGFGRIVFTFETEGSNQPRTVYMREKAQPENIYPSFNGHSIGRWDGQVLVVDTTGFLERGTFPGGVPVTGDSHLTERFSWSKASKEMADTEERFEVWCEPDLDAFKTLDLNALKAADPEVARLLDAGLRPSDPALKFAPPMAAK